MLCYGSQGKAEVAKERECFKRQAEINIVKYYTTIMRSEDQEILLNIVKRR